MFPNAELEDEQRDAAESFQGQVATDQSFQTNVGRQWQPVTASTALDATAFARVLEASGDALVVFDASWRYIYVNELAVAILGKKRTELIGHTVTDVFPEIVHTPFWEVYQRAVREQALLTVEAFFEPLNKWFDVRAIPQNGLLYLHFRDVTGQKQAEEHTRLREEQTTKLLTNIFMQAPAFMAALRGPEHVFEMANPPYYQLVGHREIIGKPVAEALPEVVNQGFVELLDRVYETGEPFIGKDVPILLQTTPEAPLQERYLDFSYQPLFNANGTVAGILAHGIDLTERKVAEDALRNAEAELARRTRNHAALVESATDSLARYDRDLRFVFVNPAFEKFTGFTFEQIVGKTLREAGFPEENVAAWEPTYRRVFETGEPVQTEVTINLLSDGQPRTFERVITPEFDPSGSGEVTTILTFSRDITERKQAERRERFLSDLTARTRVMLDPDTVLEETLRAIGNFLELSRVLYTDVDEKSETITTRLEYIHGQGIERSVRTWPLSTIKGLAPELKAGKTTVNSDTAVDPRTHNKYETVYLPSEVRAIVSVPLMREGEWVGCFCAIATTPRNWTSDEVTLLEGVAERMWVSMESARLFREEQRRAERQSLLSQASELLNASLDYKETLANVAHLIVPRLADWCSVDVLDSGGTLQRLAVEHVDPEKVAWGWELHRRYPPRLDAPTGIAAVLRTGEPSFTPVVTDEMLVAAVSDAEQLRIVREVGLTSGIIVPLSVRDRVFGALSLFATQESGRYFGEDDLEFALEVGRRSALAIENARLFQATQEAEARQRRIADTLQQSLLLTPPASDAFPGLEVDTHYEAAWDEALIGGDYGDAFKVGEHRVALLAGDCTGKGLAAARFVAECEFMARAFLRENPDNPADALARLNRALINGQQLDERPVNALTTLSVVVIDTLAGEALVTAGGAEPPLIFRAESGDVEEVQIAGALLGMDAQAEFDTISVALAAGDVLILTTDGTTEARNRKSRRFFGCDGLIRAVEGDVLRGKSISGTARKVVDEAKHFAGGVLADDACVLVARFTGDSAGNIETHSTGATDEKVEPFNDLAAGKEGLAELLITNETHAQEARKVPTLGPEDTESSAEPSGPAPETAAVLQPLTASLLECVTSADVVEVVVERGIVVLGAQAGLVALLSHDGKELEIVRTEGYAPEYIQKWGRFPVDGPYPLSDVVRTGQAVYQGNYAHWGVTHPLMVGQVESAFQTFISLPLVARQRVFGALHFSFAGERTFTGNDQAFLDELARQCALALERALLLEDVKAARQQTETVLQSIDEEFFAFDAEWRFTYINRRAQQVWQRSADAFLGKTLVEVFPEGGQGPIYEAEKLAMQERRPVRFEAVSPVRNRWVEGNVYPTEGGGISVYVRDIHERKVAEAAQRDAVKALHTSEARYRGLLDNSLEGVLFLSTQATVTSVNEQFVRMLRYDSPDELVGKSALSLIFPEDEQQTRKRWAARLEGVQETYELRVRRKDNSECWTIAHASVEKDPETGVIVGTFTMLTDITERRRVQEALIQKSREVTTILESVTDAFFALDENWNFTYVNAEAEQVLLRQPGELIGKNVWVEFPAAIGSEFETQYRRVAKEHVTVSFQAYYPAPLDSWYSVRAYPSPTGTGLSVYFQNINEERRREQEREAMLAEQKRLIAQLEAANARQSRSLNESEERFRLLVEQVQDYAIFMLDPEGYIATWNAGAERFKGYKADEIIGQHFSRFYTEEDIARRHPWAELEIAAREGRYEEEGWRIRKDGSRFWANVVITALRDKEGKLRGFGKVTRDVTERRVRDQERATNQALEQQRRFLKDVLASVTEGKLVLCDDTRDLPRPLSSEGTEEPIVLSKRALKTVRTAVTGMADRCSLPQDRIQDLITAASECAMNAVQHAGGGMVRIYGDVDAGTVQVWVQDTGRGIDLTSLPRATLEAGFSTGGGGIGHGFSLMIACCQRVSLLTGARGTTVVLEQNRVTSEPSWLQSLGTLRVK